MKASPSLPGTLEETLARAAKDYFDNVLRLTRGDITLTAQIAGRNRCELYRCLDRHGVDYASYRPGKKIPLSVQLSFKF